jgi:hypothetical protein
MFAFNKLFQLCPLSIEEKTKFAENAGLKKMLESETPTMGKLYSYTNPDFSFFFTKYAIIITHRFAKFNDYLPSFSNNGFVKILDRNEVDGNIVTYRKDNIQVDFLNPDASLVFTIYMVKTNYDGNFNGISYNNFDINEKRRFFEQNYRDLRLYELVEILPLTHLTKREWAKKQELNEMPVRHVEPVGEIYSFQGLDRETGDLQFLIIGLSTISYSTTKLQYDDFLLETQENRFVQVKESKDRHGFVTAYFKKGNICIEFSKNSIFKGYSYLLYYYESDIESQINRDRTKSDTHSNYFDEAEEKRRKAKKALKNIDILGTILLAAEIDFFPKEFRDIIREEVERRNLPVSLESDESIEETNNSLSKVIPDPHSDPIVLFLLSKAGVLKYYDDFLSIIP